MDIGSIQSQIQATGDSFKNTKTEEDKKIESKSPYSSSNPRIKFIDPQELRSKYGLLEKINLDSSKVDIKETQDARERLSALKDLMKEQNDSAVMAQSKASMESVLQVLA